MAHLNERLPQNVPGEFYVDRTCIDCDICRQLAPAVFDRSEIELSYVHRQPATEDEHQRALMALVACPTASIGTVHRLNAGAGARAFPEPIAGDVHYCGFAAEASFGASSYLIRRPEGNVLVDSPRAAHPLMERIDELGGVDLMFLTHRDDVADHRRFHRRFGCDRILHRDDVTQGTADIERQPSGRDPIPLASDLLMIPVPGHTPGSAALLYQETFLFTGDHLWWSDKLGRLHASRSVCWYSWAEQKRSIERLLDFRFEWVLPGHGRRHHAASPAAMRAELSRLIRWTRKSG
jgi:glyoxylase-like metal-dependent hydrolase (beta-lactamase superfamily II)/ferredoxin